MQPSRDDVTESLPRASGPFQWFGRMSLAGRFLLVVAALFGLVCLLFAEENWRGRRAWENCRRELERKGVQLDMEKFVPPPVPDDQNFAMTPFLAPLFDFSPRPQDPGQKPWRDVEGHERAINFAAALLPTDKNGQVLPSRFDGKLTDLEEALLSLRSQSNKPPASTSAFSSRAEAAAAVLTALVEYQPVLEELRTASHRPYARFNIDYDAEDPISILLPHYMVLLRAIRVLELKASAELALDKTDAAFEDSKLMYYLAGSIATEPFMVGAQVRNSGVKRVEQIVWEGLLAQKWSEDQLRDLQALFAKVFPLQHLERGLQAERAALGEKGFRYVRTHKNALRLWVASEGPASSSLAYLLAGPTGWMYQEQVSYHRLYDKYVLNNWDSGTERLHPRDLIEKQKLMEHELARSPLWHHTAFAKLVSVNLLKSFQRTAVSENRARETVVACALERYRLATAKYPDSLDALIPQFVDKVPTDVCDGRPLKYQHRPDGQFLLYGVGWNEKDENGLLVMSNDASDIDADQGDWVWPQYRQ